MTNEDSPERKSDVGKDIATHIEHINGAVAIGGGDAIDASESQSAVIGLKGTLIQYFGDVIFQTRMTPIPREIEAPELPDVPCPYQGLEPFIADHAAFYFGREAMVELLVEKIRQSDFVAVVGPSGCGKSSLIRAGLVRGLQYEKLTKTEKWAIQVFRPGVDPLRALAGAFISLLAPDADDADHILQTRRLADGMRNGVPVADVCARVLERCTGISHVVLIADQFEELYTECQDEDLRALFVKSLLAVSEHGIRVVLTLRADFYGRALADRRLGEVVGAGQINVLPMNEGELRAAIEKPALHSGRSFEAGLVERILEDIVGEPGSLPLLEFALTGLWERQTTAGVLTHEAYETIGRVEGAIAQRAEAIFDELVGKRETVRHIFTRLTRYGEDVEGTRRRETLDGLVTARAPRKEIESTIGALADARLVVAGRDVMREAVTVEVAHEALIPGWERLQHWLDEDRAFGLWRQKVDVAIKMWVEANREEDTLLRGAPLAEAEGWLEERIEDLNEVERTFVETSLALRERRRRRRDRGTALTIAISVVIAAIMAVLGIVSYQSSRQVREQATVVAQAGTDVAEALQTSDLLLAEVSSQKVTLEIAATKEARLSRASLAQSLMASALLSESDDELATLLAIEAWRIAPDVSGASRWLADRTMRTILSQPHFSSILRGHEYGVLSVASSPDGRWLASGDGDGTLRLWDMHNLASDPVNLVGHNRGVGVSCVSFSPDHVTLASGGREGSIILWDVNTESSIGKIMSDHKHGVETLAFSPDGKTLASGGRDGRVQMWNLATWEGQTLEGHDGTVHNVAFIRDGRILASGGEDRTVRLWDIATETSTRLPLQGHDHEVYSMAFSPDGETLASGGCAAIITKSGAELCVQGEIRLWRVDDHSVESIRQPLIGHTAAVIGMAFSPDGETLASGGRDDAVYLWDISPPEETGADMGLLLGQPLVGHSGAVNGVTFVDSHVLASGSSDRTVRLWNLHNPIAEPQTLDGHEFNITSMAFGLGDSVLASCGEDGRLLLWDLQNPGEKPNLLGSSWSCHSVAFSHDGQVLGAFTSDDTLTIEWWKVRDRPEQLRVEYGQENWATSANFSIAEEFRPFIWDESALLLWNLRDMGADPRKLRYREDWINVTGVFDPDGNILASGGDDGTIQLWDLNNLGAKPQLLNRHTDWIIFMAFSPDGGTLASIDADGVVWVWDLRNQSERQLSGPTYGSWSIAFSLDGKMLAVGYTDGSVRLWDLDNPAAEPLNLAGHDERVTALAFSLDGGMLASGSIDGSIQLHIISPEKLMELGCQQVHRNLNTQEWHQYLPNEENYRETCVLSSTE